MRHQDACPGSLAQSLCSLLLLICCVLSSLHLPTFFFFDYLFILAALGFRCFAWAFSSYGEQGQLFAGVHALLVVVISLVVECSL